MPAYSVKSTVASNSVYMGGTSANQTGSDHIKLAFEEFSTKNSQAKYTNNLQFREKPKK